MSALDMLLRRLRLLIDRTLLRRAGYTGSVRVLQVQLRDGVALDGVEHVEPYGFTSHPLPGAEAIVASLGGNRSRALVLLVSDRRHRIVIAEGETAMYTHNGERVHIRADGSIHVRASTRVLMETPEIEMTGNLIVGGTIVSDGDQIAGGVSQINHPHGGVVPGGGVSEGPIPS